MLGKTGIYELGRQERAHMCLQSSAVKWFCLQLGPADFVQPLQGESSGGGEGRGWC